MNPETVRSIVAAGVQAPSADNRHAFRVLATGDTLDLIATGDAGQPGIPRHRRALLQLSYGAVVENMALRAAELGDRLAVDWSPDAGRPSLVARLTRSPSVDPPSDLAAAIAGRHTNRRMYRGPAPDARQSALLEAEVRVAGSPTLHWLEGDQRKQALALIWLAESERFRRRALHDELFGAIRFDVGWRSAADEGLPPATLEVEAPMRPMFAALRRWPLMKALAAVGGHRMLGMRAGWMPCWQAPALGVITCASADDADFAAAGRGFQRLWLRATLLGLALQPAAASAVLGLQDDVPEGISAAARERLLTGWSVLFPGRSPAMVFRLGHADAPTARTGRRPVESHLVDR